MIDKPQEIMHALIIRVKVDFDTLGMFTHITYPNNYMKRFISFMLHKT